MIRRKLPPFCPFSSVCQDKALQRYKRPHQQLRTFLYTVMRWKKSWSFFPNHTKVLSLPTLVQKTSWKKAKRNRKFFPQPLSSRILLFRNSFQARTALQISLQAHSAVMSLEIRASPKLKEPLLLLPQSLCFLTFKKKLVILSLLSDNTGQDPVSNNNAPNTWEDSLPI